MSAFDLTTEIVIQRGQLKHSWLENQLTNKSEEDVVLLWRGPGWPALERQFAARVREARELVEKIEDGYSPAQLVDRLAPLADLSGETREAIKGAVHAAYLEKIDVTALKATLRVAVDGLGAALDAFLWAWGQPVSAEVERELRERWRELHRCAEGLRAALEQLPRSIVLP